jgi:uncharacterized membrane protein
LRVRKCLFPVLFNFSKSFITTISKVLPGVSSVALLAPILWAISARRHAVEFRLVLLAVLAIGVGSAITFIYNVPVNDVLETWNYNSPPSNARELWQPWESAHVVRTIFWTVGF